MLEEGDFFLDVGDIVVFGVEIDDFECDDVVCCDVFFFVYCVVCVFVYDFEFLWWLVVLWGEDVFGRVCLGWCFCVVWGVW